MDRRHRAGQLGFVCFGINLVVTLNRLRAPGLAWRRMPLFSWAAAVVGWLLVVIGPMMIAALTMLEIDRHFDGVFFDAGEGGAPLLYEHLAYVYFTGAYLIVFLRPPGPSRRSCPPSHGSRSSATGPWPPRSSRSASSAPSRGCRTCTRRP